MATANIRAFNPLQTLAAKIVSSHEIDFGIRCHFSGRREWDFDIRVFDGQSGELLLGHRTAFSLQRRPHIPDLA